MGASTYPHCMHTTVIYIYSCATQSAPSAGLNVARSNPIGFAILSEIKIIEIRPLLTGCYLQVRATCTYALCS